MSANFYELQKFAATGIASPDMTAFDKARALAAFGGKTQTLTDVPPLNFRATGKPLVSWSMLGNGQQSGTPTPENPIQPTFCGVRTGNLAPPLTEWVDGYINSGTGTIHDPSATQEKSSAFIAISDATEITISYENGNLPSTGTSASTSEWTAVGWYDDTKTFISRTVSNAGGLSNTHTAPSGAAFVRISFRTFGETGNIMLNSGTTALPYEPFGYKIPISCAGQTTPVYLGQVQTVRRVRKMVLTGEENWIVYSGFSAQNCYQFYTNIINRDASAGAINTHFVYTNTLRIFIDNDGTFMFDRDKYIRVHMSSSATVDDFKSYLAAQYAAGTPVCVWYVLAEPTTGITNEPLCKIGDYADELSSTDAGVTIPTAKGHNTLTVDTELQPSSMTITYKE